MSVKHALLALVVIGICSLGCGNKPSESVPSSPPGEVKEAYEILENLQYLGVRKDLKHISVISLTDSNIAYEEACRLHRHAGELGISLRDQDIIALGVTDLRTKGYLVPDVSRKDLLEARRGGGSLPPELARHDIEKVDLLPESGTLPSGKPDPVYAELRSRYAQVAMQAGIYRVVSGVPEALWPRLSVLETKPSGRSSDVLVVSIGVNHEPVLMVSVMKNKMGSYGIHDLALLRSPSQLLALLGK